MSRGSAGREGTRPGAALIARSAKGADPSLNILMSSFHAVEALLPNRSCLGSPLSEGSDFSQVLSNCPPGPWSNSLSWLPVTGWRGGCKLTGGEELSRCRGRMGQCFGDFLGLPSNISPSCFSVSDVKRAQTNLHIPVRAFEVMQYAGIRLDELRLGQKKRRSRN